ncbi:MAG: hypothetical protein ACM31F_07210, partial [Gemmatimonas sp.]
MTATARSVPRYNRRPRSATRKTTFLRTVILLAAVFPGALALAGETEIPPATQALGFLTWFLCAMPAYLYLRRDSARRRPLPFYPAISFIYGLYYALPIALGEVNRAWRITVDPHDGYDTPIQLALFGWIAMTFGYSVIVFLLRGRKREEPIPWRPALIAKWAYVFLIGGVTINALRTLISGMAGVGGFLQLFVSLQWLGLGLLTVLARRRELPTSGRIVLVGGFIAAVAVALAQGNISPVVLLCVVVAFSLWAGRQVIEPRWVVAGVFALLVAISLRGVIRDFRMTAWFGTQQFSQVERMQLMVKLLSDRVDNEGIVAALGGGASQTAQRSANMDVFADVVRRTPAEIPYWRGQTYYSLVGSFVPRFLWPDKPTKELGQAFGHRYRYLDPTNNSTAINLPILVEFYANFGAVAVVIGMFFVGSLYGLLDGIVNRPGQTMIMSMMALTLLIPLLIIESDFSLVFGGLPLNGFALYLIWRAMRRTA